jgi:hypothetical protein
MDQIFMTFQPGERLPSVGETVTFTSTMTCVTYMMEVRTIKLHRTYRRGIEYKITGIRDLVKEG